MRRFYQQADGSWVQRVDGNPVDALAASEAAATAEYGVPLTAVDVNDDETDPRTGQLLAPPTVPAPIRLTVDEKLDAILSTLATSKVLPADEKAALEALR